MILILAESTDPWGVALARRLTLRGEPFVLQDPGELCASTIDRTAEWVQQLTGVYRGANRPYSGDTGAVRPRAVAVAESDWLAELNALPCPVVNRLSPDGVPSCPTGSPAWEAVVSAHGFQTPCFYNAPNRDEAVAGLDLWGVDAYVKPAGVLHGGLVLSLDAAKAYVEDLEEDRPVLLAQISAGQLVSVFVVGDKVVATVVRSMPKSGGSAQGACLSPSLLQRCSDLVPALGLVHAECLLSLSADGLSTCLDVVASPNYWTCPREAQRQVVSGLVQYLAEDRCESAPIPAVSTAEAVSSGDCVGTGIPGER